MQDDDEEITVRTAARESGLSKRYINADIKAGRLEAREIEGLGNLIKRSKFREWLANPARGTGQQRRKPTAHGGGDGVGGNVEE